ncbi:MAG: hypothetical protein KatS3mg096_790 [Candidatus Parcubacteria bacterium]|nr:MAG: hypothetical protein KatS3mg096_790 [Candidatus Parcubacteria bacterium]
MERQKRKITTIEAQENNNIEDGGRELKQFWYDTFQKDFVVPNSTSLEHRINDGLEEFFTKLTIEIKELVRSYIEIRTSKLEFVAMQIKNNLPQKLGDTLGDYIDYLGFKRLPQDIKFQLREKSKKIGKFVNFYPISSYHSIPPKEILDLIKRVGCFFDNLEIWAIEDKQFLKDPILVGVIFVPKYVGSELRYYLLGLWGDDISVEDLMKSTGSTTN